MMPNRGKGLMSTHRCIENQFFSFLLCLLEYVSQSNHREQKNREPKKSTGAATMPHPHLWGGSHSNPENFQHQVCVLRYKWWQAAHIRARQNIK